MRLANRTEIFQHIRDAREAYAMTWRELAAYTGRAACYYEGVQWISMDRRAGSPSLGRLFTNWNPDQRQLRVTANKITRNTVKVAAQTEPTSINIDVSPPDRDLGPEASMRAQVMEDALYALIEYTGFLEPRKVANLRRTIMGDYALGLAIERGTRSLDMNGKTVQAPDASMRVFTVPVTEFVLDPYEDSQNLEDHEFVWWREPWTVDKIRRRLGVTLNPMELKTIGELAFGEMELNALSDGRLFAQYKKHSRTKGAMVWQGHFKDESGRFSKMHIVIDKAGNKSPHDDGMTLVNENSDESPFGGSGLPFAMYHCAKRSDSMFSISDVWLQIDDQNRLNLMETLKFRWYQACAGFKVFVDRRTIKDQGAEESFKNQWNNRVGGMVVFDSHGNRFANEPKVAQMPLPPQQLTEESLQYGAQMEKQLQVSEINFGVAKSHVPDATNQSLIEQSTQSANVRVKEDIRTDGCFLTMMLGTAIGLAKEGSPSVLGCLRRHGFDEGDLAAFLTADPEYPACNVTVRESSVRNRSPEGRRNDINNALQFQAISPDQARMAYAMDLDAPITGNDGYMQSQASKAALRVLTGEEWQPLSLGEYTTFFTQAFRNALFDKRASRDPSARQRLERAIQSQQQASALQSLASNPDFLAQQAAAQQQAQQAQAEQETEQQPQPQTIGEALALAGGSNATPAKSAAA